MEVSRLENELKYVESSGNTLSTEERLRLTISVEDLYMALGEEQRAKMYFWGKVRGTVKDYLIVYTLTGLENIETVPQKTFYWASTTNYIFARLDASTRNAEQLKDFESCMFTGEFDTVLCESNEGPTVIDAAAGIILPPKHLTELDRLRCTVA